MTSRGGQTLDLDADTDRATLAQRLREVAQPGGCESLAGVISLVALSGGELARTLTVLQALGDAQVEAPVWLLTRGAVSVGRSDRQVELGRAISQAQVWGLGRVLGLEHPQRWGGLVDLPETLDHRAQARLAAVLAGLGTPDTGVEDQVAIRTSGITVRRLSHAPAPVSAPPTAAAKAAGWIPRGTVLITGGTGGLGGQVARWAATHGAEHLVLTSRRGPAAPGAAELRAELTTLGVQVTITACDLADADAVARLLAPLTSVPGDDPARLTAVLHAAGVSEDLPLMQADAEHLHRVLAGKVHGAVSLAELLAGTPLQAFVVFSSISGIWGSGGQAAYGAANAGLDALIEHRRAHGQVGTALACGAVGAGRDGRGPGRRAAVAPQRTGSYGTGPGGGRAGPGGRRR